MAGSTLLQTIVILGNLHCLCVAHGQMVFLGDEEQENSTGYAKNHQPFLHIEKDDPLAWRNQSLSAHDRATLLVSAMNATEKAKLMSRWGKTTPGKNDWTGGTVGIERLQVPPVQYNDGPQGFRDEKNHGTTTAWPSVLAFSQTWDYMLVDHWGQLMGKEFRDKGAGVQLGPGMNVMRIGLNGRDFEYISGEDPVVGAELVASLINGIQMNGILANMKHYVNNNQEINRVGQSANVDERTQMEMYYPPFEAAVRAKVGSAMCSYNRINQVYSCANNQTLNRHLRDLFGFEGFVMSDWGAIHGRPKEYVPAGCEQEQGSVEYYNVSAIQSDLSKEQIDKAVYRIVKSFIRAGRYEEDLPDNFNSNVTSVEHQQFAQEGAEKSTILLKNVNHTLPLNKADGSHHILVLGNAALHPIIAGGGSGQVHTDFVYPPLWALCDELGIERQNFTMNATTVERVCNETNQNCISYYGVDSVSPPEDAGNGDESRQKEVRSIPKSMRDAQYTATLVFAGVFSGEGDDRKDLSWNSKEVLASLKNFTKKGKVIGALTAPGPILINNLANVSDAILFNIMPGQQYARALMRIIFGAVSPSAKLTFTMPNIENEQNMTAEQYPGSDDQMNSSYSEKHHFGYRWYDQYNVTPAFEFGFGLTYTNFTYSALHINSTSREVSFSVTNTGNMTASEIIQVYLSAPATENFSGGYRSPKELKVIYKFRDLPVGDQRDQAFIFPERAFSYWSVKDQKWVEEPGTYQVLVGASSRDIRLQGNITITG